MLRPYIGFSFNLLFRCRFSGKGSLIKGITGQNLDCQCFFLLTVELYLDSNIERLRLINFPHDSTEPAGILLLSRKAENLLSETFSTTAFYTSHQHSHLVILCNPNSYIFQIVSSLVLRHLPLHSIKQEDTYYIQSHELMPQNIRFVHFRQTENPFCSAFH